MDPEDVLQLPLDFTGEEYLEVLRTYYPLLFDEAWTIAGEELGVSLVFDLDNPLVQEVLDELALRVQGIANTTIEDLQRLVGKQAELGWDLDQLADEILSYGEISSKGRAYMIAATETASAYTKGSLLAYLQSGVVDQIEWLTYEPCDLCSGLSGVRVNLGEKFNNGKGWEGEGPPVHPFCRCAVAPVIIT